MKISRRFFLKSAGTFSLYCGLAPSLLFAEEKVTPKKTLVVIFLRGGLDGLNMIVPYQDPWYYQLRKNIAIAPPGKNNGAIDLDGFFGLHPRAQALKPLFDSQDALALHAVGYSQNTRSHFAEQDVWETGLIGNTIYSDGWLNRHLMTSQGHGPVRAIALSDNLPRILQGEASAYAIRGLQDLTVPTLQNGNDMAAALENAYADFSKKEEAENLLSQAGENTLEILKILNKVAEQPYTAKASYPQTPLANKLSEAARLIKADIGVEVVEVDYGGWDTHRNQGNAGGPYGNLTQGLAEAIASFTQDLGDKLKDVLVLTLSDFGRTARQNGSGGTDHGWGNCMFMVGGSLTEKKNSPVIAQWPGLSPEQLHQKRDLKHTRDFRDVIAEVVGEHLGNHNLKKILPQYKFQKLGIL